MGDKIECADGQVRFFGLPSEGHENDGAPVRQHVKCQNTGCVRARPEEPPVPIHEDTQRPVFCGGCGKVLLCDHVTPHRPVEHVVGTVREPVLVKVWACRECGTTLREEKEAMSPLALDDLPMSALAGLGIVLEAREGDER